MAGWAAGWALYQVVRVTEGAGLERSAEVLDVVLAAPAGAVGSLAREVRVARVVPGDGGAAGRPQEVPSQIYGEERRRPTGPPSGTGERGERRAHLVWQADVPPGGEVWYLVLAGNPAAELPQYPSDLRVDGEGFGLDVENDHFRASLSRQTGQLERLTYRRAHGLELFAGGEGHGEPPHIDWAHDYLAGDRFNKFRVTNWETCPNYEVVRGPLCVTVRRWGVPHSPLHPAISAADMLVDLTYTFFAGAPYFTKHGRMQTIQDFSLNYLRDDEWVFSGYCFDGLLWMGEDGTLREGPVAPEAAEQMWGVGFYNHESRDAIFSLRLEHRLEGPSAVADGSGRLAAVAPEQRAVLRHADGPMMSYVPHGHVWSRWALRGTPQMLAGDTLWQRNAYLVEPYLEGAGGAVIEGWRARFLAPLTVAAAPGGLPADLAAGATAAGALARPGEGPGAREAKAALWQALRAVRDEMFYLADANVVDMGYVYDLRLRGETVQVQMTMPQRGRPRHMFVGQHMKRVLEEVPGVRTAVIDLTWDPPWTPDRMSDAGRKAMRLDD
jgi:metal-sulfur cluster biosynthetic enzyme